MNIAAFVSGPVVDGLTIGLQKSNGLSITNDYKLSANRMVIFACFIFAQFSIINASQVIITASSVCLVSVIITYTSLREIRVSDSEETDNIESPTHNTTDNDFEVVIDFSTENKNYSHLDNSESSKQIANNSDITAFGNSSCHQLMPKVTDNIEIQRVDTQPPHNHVTELNLKTHSQESYDEIRLDEIYDVDEVKQIEELSMKDETTIIDVNTNDVKKASSMYEIIKELIYSPTLYRFTIFSLFLINLNAVFRHLDATLPTYLIRNFGPNVKKGLIYSINPFIIIFTTPLVAGFTSKYAHYDMIKYGGYVTALSPFFLAFSTSIWACVCFVTMLSFGEAIWSPRTYDYTMSISPEG